VCSAGYLPNCRRSRVPRDPHRGGRLNPCSVGRLARKTPEPQAWSVPPAQYRAPELHTLATVTQSDTGVTCELGDLLHAANEQTHPVPQQARVGRRMDARLNHSSVTPEGRDVVKAHLPPASTETSSDFPALPTLTPGPVNHCANWARPFRGSSPGVG